MKRLILWWLATCTAAAVTGQPKQALTFDQALEMTMTRNPELEAISYEKGTQGRLRVTIAQSIRNGRLYLYGR